MRVQKDNVFWKRRFELLVKQEYPSTKTPGVTTWHHKVEALERHGAKGLLLSNEPLDVEVGIRIVITDTLTPAEKLEITGQALLIGNTRIIMAVASVPGLEFKKYAAKAVEQGVEMLESQDDNKSTVYHNLPVAVLKLIMHPLFGLHVDIPLAIRDNMPHAPLEVLITLLNDPQALLMQNGEDYLLLAWYHDRNNVFFYMLDHTDVTMDAGVFGDLYDENDHEMTAEFLNHPKTAVFLQ